PSPHASDELIAIAPTPLTILKWFIFNSPTACTVSPQPPKALIAAIGAAIKANNIKVPWIKSVQTTAKKPPRKVRDTTTKTPIQSAHWYDKPKDDSNNFAPATIPEDL